MLDAWIYDGLRTPFGRHAGALAPVRPDDLVAGVMRALVARSPWPAEALEDVYLGCTNQAGEDSRNVARHASLLAGFPVTVPAQTVNRLCASGLAAVVDAARALTVGDGEVLGWSWLVPPYKWHFDARSLTDTRALALDGRCLRGKFENDHELGYEMMTRFAQLMTQRLEAASLQLLDLYGTNA